ncbi:amino acid adenylation domain-containing protein [Streptomyces castrisilvae]|uniref:Amino acid adenylation domain-containing protein n=1 Tax=Streptomyces castrisilvae TaxID=3033811 RepID=A0ABY9HVE9_9ACTN|nr:amino acid adenylation domain-containing protein [Streptomyces sp. Mut1]WLQ37992.1 amino acid adenylation domain-containing protein [Streptomyces sp. Mut1]
MPASDQQPHPSAPGVSGPPAGTHAAAVLSVGQERLWFLDQFEPGDPAYNIPLVLRLTGPLSPEALRAALDAVAGRHDALRSRFPATDGRPYVVVGPPAPVPFDSRDLRGCTDADAAALTGEFTNRAFDLAQGPLLRAALLRTGESAYTFCLVVHHIVADGWSLGLLRSELAALYSAYRSGGGAELSEPPSYLAHAAAERAWLDGAGATAALGHWRQLIDGAEPLALPLERPRPEVPSSRGAYHTRVLRGLGGAVEAFARARRLTPFMVIAAAYQTLLHRCTGQDDFCVGVPTAARTTVDSERTVGYFSSTLVLRADFSGTRSFDTVLRQIRGDWLRALAHGRVPFERLTEELRQDRDTGRTPVFQTLLTVHTQSGGALGEHRFADLVCAEGDGGHTAAKSELSLDVRPDGDDLHAVFGYRTDLLDAEQTARFAARFEVLLRAALEAPGTPVHLLPLLDERESALRRDEAAGPALAPYPPTVLAAIDRAALTAGAPALVGPGESLTRGELADASRALAARLLAHGVRRGGLVAFCLPRGPRPVVAMLAAWRVGAGFLALDQEYPAARLDFMLRDSGAAVLLTADGEPVTGLTSDVPVLSAAPGPGTPAGPLPGPGTEAGPDDPAYVIYTSGSTGTPKGVLVPHRALAARVAWMRQGYGLGESDRVLHSASLSFDTSAEEIFPALASGAVLVTARPGAALGDQLAEPYAAGITVLDLPTPYWHHLVADLGETPWPDTLRLVVLGADQVRAEAVAAWRARFGDTVRLVNSYGPTETAVIATTAELGAADGLRRPPIGRPIGATTLAVLDRNGTPVPPGTPGELVIGGAGVGDGYLGRPGVTARAFVPDPDGPPGARRYRTGDRVRRRADGQLEFLGRLDGQVKVRGFRVEPGEVEAALTALPSVAEAVVSAREDRLVAHVVPAPDTAPPDPARLRAELAAALPPHLVPSAWAVLDRLPLTPNGKVDRAALPDPGAASPGRAAFVPPGTEAEELVADIWRQVLGTGPVGADDDFFDLGGHSLLATRVIARLRASVDLAVPLRTLFTHRTCAAFAEAVEAALTAEIDALSDTAAEELLAAQDALEGSRPRS